MFAAAASGQLADLRSRVEVLADVDLGTIDDAGLDRAVRELGELSRVLEAETLRWAGEWERRKVWARDGSRSARACLSRRWGIGIGAAGERLRTAARLREAPLTRAAFAAGALSFDQTRVLCLGVDEQLTDTARERFQDAEADLVAAAQALSASQLREVMAFWLASVDPDRDDPNKRPDPYDKRGLSVAATFEGMVHVQGMLDPEQGQLVLRVLRDIEAKMWRADHPAGHDDHTCPESCEHHATPRTDRQRCADALAELCRTAVAFDHAGPGRDHDAESGGDDVDDTETGDRARDGAADGTHGIEGIDEPADARPSGKRLTTAGTRRRVAAIVDLPALAQGHVGRSMLADTHTPLSVDAVRRILCDSTVHGVVLDPSQVPLAYTHGKGQVPHGLRAAVILRDGHCAFPGCRMPPSNCEVHHLTYRSRGGTHRLDCCVLVCHHHHHLFHEGGWTGHIDPSSGRACFRDPDGNWHGAEPSPLQLATLAVDAARPPDRSPPLVPS